MRGVFDVAVVGLLAAVQEALADLKSTARAPLLVTNGAFGEVNPQIDAMAVGMKVMGVALANAAKHKLVGLLSERLKGEGVYVGEVMVAGAVKGTAFEAAPGHRSAPSPDSSGRSIMRVRRFAPASPEAAGSMSRSGLEPGPAAKVRAPPTRLCQNAPWRPVGRPTFRPGRANSGHCLLALNWTFAPDGQGQCPTRSGHQPGIANAPVPGE